MPYISGSWLSTPHDITQAMKDCLSPVLLNSFEYMGMLRYNQISPGIDGLRHLRNDLGLSDMTKCDFAAYLKHAEAADSAARWFSFRNIALTLAAIMLFQYTSCILYEERCFF